MLVPQASDKDMIDDWEMPFSRRSMLEPSMQACVA